MDHNNFRSLDSKQGRGDAKNPSIRRDRAKKLKGMCNTGQANNETFTELTVLPGKSANGGNVRNAGNESVDLVLPPLNKNNKCTTPKIKTSRQRSIENDLAYNEYGNNKHGSSVITLQDKLSIEATRKASEDSCYSSAYSTCGDESRKTSNTSDDFDIEDDRASVDCDKVFDSYVERQSVDLDTAIVESCRRTKQAEIEKEQAEDNGKKRKESYSKDPKFDQDKIRKISSEPKAFIHTSQIVGRNPREGTVTRDIAIVPINEIRYNNVQANQNLAASNLTNQSLADLRSFDHSLADINEANPSLDAIIAANQGQDLNNSANENQDEIILTNGKFEDPNSGNEIKAINKHCTHNITGNENIQHNKDTFNNEENQQIMKLEENNSQFSKLTGEIENPTKLQNRGRVQTEISSKKIKSNESGQTDKNAKLDKNCVQYEEREDSSKDDNNSHLCDKGLKKNSKERNLKEKCPGGPGPAVSENQQFTELQSLVSQKSDNSKTNNFQKNQKLTKSTKIPKSLSNTEEKNSLSNDIKKTIVSVKKSSKPKEKYPKALNDMLAINCTEKSFNENKKCKEACNQKQPKKPLKKSHSCELMESDFPINIADNVINKKEGCQNKSKCKSTKYNDLERGKTAIKSSHPELITEEMASLESRGPSSHKRLTSSHGHGHNHGDRKDRAMSRNGRVRSTPDLVYHFCPTCML